MKLRGILAAAVALGGLALAAGCGDQSGTPLGFGDTTPTPGTFLAIDIQPADPFDPNIPGDTVDSSAVICNALVLDASSSDGFRLYADPDRQGLRAVTDYVAPSQNAFSTGYKVYFLVARPFDPGANTWFVAHGARGGLENTAAAVSQMAFSPRSTGVELSRRTFIQLLTPANGADTDTVPLLSWTPVPNAAQYVVQISNGIGLQYMAIVPGPSHRVGSPPATFIQFVALTPDNFFNWTVLAVDADNRVIGFMPEPGSFITRPQP
jgi:hypothetical protein